MKVAFVAWDECSLEDVSDALITLRESDCAVRTLTLGGQSVITNSGLTIQADGCLETVNARDYGLLVMPSGGVTPNLVEDPRLQRFVRQLNGQHNAWLSASGASTAILAAAGLLGGVKFTGPKRLLEEYAEYFRYSAWVDEDVCVDGNVITTNGHTHRLFARTLCVRLNLPTASLDILDEI